jgi:hypothetical protein
VTPLRSIPWRARLLDEAGWRGTRGWDAGPRRAEFAFELLVSAGSNIGRQIDEMLATGSPGSA